MEHRTNVTTQLQRMSITMGFEKYFSFINIKDKLKKLVVQDKVNSVRPRGHSPEHWIVQIKEFTGLSTKRNIIKRVI